MRLNPPQIEGLRREHPFTRALVVLAALLMPTVLIVVLLGHVSNDAAQAIVIAGMSTSFGLMATAGAIKLALLADTRLAHIETLLERIANSVAPNATSHEDEPPPPAAAVATEHRGELDPLPDRADVRPSRTASTAAQPVDGDGLQ